ncbi:TCEA3 protein, partial [Alectura lathami]|nr:TCEA3 protein [Alectura lathami]
MGPAEELVRIAKKLDKMVARKSTEGALDLLKSLTGYTMTIQLLQTTRIGVAVNSVRKHCSDEEVVASAKILIKNWKRLLESSAPPKKEKDTDGEKEKKEKEKRLDLPSCPSEGVNPHPAKHPKSPAEKHREKHKERRDSADSRSSAVSSSSSLQKRPSGERAQVLATLSGLLGVQGGTDRHPRLSFPVDDYKELGVNCEKMASEIEDHILWGAGELKSTDMKYRNRVRSRISNLKDPKNPNLRRNVLCGAIPPSLIARMTAEEMASDELKELRNAMTQEAIREHQMAKTGGTVTDLFQCGKCKKKNCTYNQVQTRSADEPMTTFVLCNECGNRWKV